MTQLFKHQQEFLTANPNKTALVWSCGTGKSRAAIEWITVGRTALVICPKALKTNWKREAGKWGAGVVIYSKEEFRKEWDDIGHYDHIIVDEVHNGFLTPNFKSQMSKALRNYLKKHKVGRILLLSATVYTSSPWNIYQLATLLGYKWNRQSFNFEYFDLIRMGMRMIPKPKKGVEKKLAEITKKIASVVDIYDCMDVPLQSHEDPEYFSLSRKQEKAIDETYDPLPIVRYTMQHEIENGVLLANEFRKAQVFESDKHDRVLDLVEENPKIAIVCRYNDQIDVLEGFLKQKGKFVYIIRGDVKNRDEVCVAAEQAKEAIVLIQADCAEGYQLPSFPLCVFASMSYSYVKWEQICGRFLRMDKPSRTTFLYLLTEGDSVDQGVYDAVKRKEDFKIALFTK